MCKACQTEPPNLQDRRNPCTESAEEYDAWKQTNLPNPIDRLLIKFIAIADAALIALIATALFNWN